PLRLEIRIYCNLTEQQHWSFRGELFTPIFVVEVGVIAKDSDFDMLNSKFRNVYFVEGTSVKLGWIIDPRNKDIWVYKKQELMFYVAIIMESFESPESKLRQCLECDQIFTCKYEFLKHYEKAH
ncbi:14924_t:CDS:2, partial [Racocetra persica]